MSKRRSKSATGSNEEDGSTGNDVDTHEPRSEDLPQPQIRKQDIPSLEAECQFYRTMLDHLISQAEQRTEQEPSPHFSVKSGLPPDVKKRMKTYKSGAKACIKFMSSKSSSEEQQVVNKQSDEYTFLVSLMSKLSSTVETEVIPDKVKLPKVPKSTTDMKDDFKKYRENAASIIDNLRQMKSANKSKLIHKGCQTECMEGLYQKQPKPKPSETRATQTEIVTVQPSNPASPQTFVEKVRNSRLAMNGGGTLCEAECVGGVNREEDLNRYIDQMEEQIFNQTCRISELEGKLEMAKLERELPKTKEVKRKDDPPPYNQTVKPDFSRTVVQRGRQDENTLIKISENLGRRVKSANPRLQDVSDEARATRIGEKFELLYEQQWLEAYKFEREKLGKSEKGAINDILEIMQTIYEMCTRFANEQFEEWKCQIELGGRVPDHLASVDRHGGSNRDEQLKQIQKANAAQYFTKIRTDVLTNEVFSSFYGQEIDGFPEFMAHCIDLCWIIRTRDPPMELVFSVDRGMSFEKDNYKHYTVVGDKADFLVWPALFLYKKGPLVQKGVIQPVSKK